MNTTEKLTMGVIGGLLIYACTLFDSKVLTFIPQAEQMVDCKVGQLTFTLRREQCKTQITKVYPFTYLDYITQ